MKRADLAVGEMYLDNRGNYVIVVDLTGWRRTRGMWANGYTRDPEAKGVAVAYCEGWRFDGDGEAWSPGIRQLQHIMAPTSREQVRREKAASEARHQEREALRERQRAEVKIALERLDALGVRAFEGSHGRLLIEAADVLRLLDLIDASELRDAVD